MADRERLHAAIAELPEEQRQVVALRLTQDLSIREVAARLGLSLGVTKQRQDAGMRSLRTLLDGPLP